MDTIDGLEIGTALSRGFATLVAILTFVGFAAWPTQSFNLLYGQTLDKAASLTNLMTDITGVHCEVQQDGLFAPPSMRCT